MSSDFMSATPATWTVEYTDGSAETCSMTGYSLIRSAQSVLRNTTPPGTVILGAATTVGQDGVWGPNTARALYRTMSALRADYAQEAQRSLESQTVTEAVVRMAIMLTNSARPATGRVMSRIVFDGFRPWGWSTAGKPPVAESVLSCSSLGNVPPPTSIPPDTSWQPPTAQLPTIPGPPRADIGVPTLLWGTLLLGTVATGAYFVIRDQRERGVRIPKRSRK